jgi:Fe-S cluster assembly ATPase SufC
MLSRTEVLVMIKGKIVKQGDYKLAEKIEKNGYGNYETS